MQNNKPVEVSNSIAGLFNHGSDISKVDAIKLLSDHLGGSWDHLAESDLEMTIQSGGFVNRLFVCENKKLSEKSTNQRDGKSTNQRDGKSTNQRDGKSTNQRDGKSPAQEPAKVLLRLFGGKLLNKFSSDEILATHGEVIETLNYYIMNQYKLGPKMYGVFPGGRIEEFVPSHSVTDPELLDPTITGSLARKLARIHNLTPPICRRPKDMIGIIQKIRKEKLAAFTDKMRQVEIPKGLEESAKKWFNFDLPNFIDWIVATLPTVSNRIVFSHNDTEAVPKVFGLFE